MAGGELLLINPRRKRRSHKKRHYTAKQRAYGFGGKRRRKRSYASRNPRKRRSVAALAVRPARRTRRTRRKSYFRRAYSGARSITGSIGGFAGSKLLPAAVGAGGALALDMAWGNLPLPSFLNSGPAAPIARIGLAVAVGYVAGMIGGKKFGDEAMTGALVVTAYDLAKTAISAQWPGAIPMNGYVSGYVSQAGGDAYGPYLPAWGSEDNSWFDYTDSNGSGSDLGYVSPARIVG